MRPSGVVLTTVFGFLALAVTVWIGRYKPESANATAAVQADPDKPIGPVVSPTGPYPKAVVDTTTFDFGTMMVGGEGQHVFTIRNEGEADLELIARKEDTTCSCTFGELSDDGKIPPGKSVDVTLNWKVKFMTETFRHRAIVRTNDPNYKEIELSITGKLDDALTMLPASPWNIGEVLSGEPSIIHGFLFSKVFDTFEIKNIQAAANLLTFETRPMTEDELKEQSAKSGYRITAKAEPTMPIGTFSDNVTITTSLVAMPEMKFLLNGIRPGPMEILGPGYTAGNSALRMGEFPAAEGKSTVISIFVRDLDEDLQLLGAEQTFDTVKVELTKDPKSLGNVQRYLLKFTVPPGEPQDRLRKKSEKINLLFNHPESPKVRIYVEFLAV